MNKGIKNARGDIIVFCNSGDFFYKNSLSKVMDLFDQKNYDFVFGTVIRNYLKGKVFKNSDNLELLLKNTNWKQL